MARPVEYFSCAKCGYRGVAKPDDHTCDPARTVATKPAITTLTDEQRSRVYGLMAAGDTVAGPAGPIPRSRAMADSASSDDDHRARTTALDQIVRESSRLVGRQVQVARDANWRLSITQRCQVCRDEITKAIAEPGIDQMQLAIAKAIRSSYLLHQCKPVEQSLFSLTYEDLDKLWQQTERDATRIAERAVEIEALLQRRKEGS